MNESEKNQTRCIIGYTACPVCNHLDIGVRTNGRIVRHSMGRRCVKKNVAICAGSGQIAARYATTAAAPQPDVNS